MENRIATNLRKWISLITAIIVYYIVHEGAHLVTALIFGTFKSIKFMGLGMQIVVDDTAMSNTQLAVFCLVGSISALAFAYILVLLVDKITALKSKYVKAIGFYTTVALLILDPLYLSILYKLFGGGDMNGLVLFGIPEISFQAIYAIIAVANVSLIVKAVYPKYKLAFASRTEQNT